MVKQVVVLPTAVQWQYRLENIANLSEIKKAGLDGWEAVSVSERVVLMKKPIVTNVI